MRSQQIAHDLGTTMKTVCSIKRLFRNTGDVKPRKSTGRPRITTAREDRVLYIMARQGRRRSAASLRHEWHQRINGRPSRETVNRRLIERGYRARRPIRQPRLTQRHRHLRLQWASQYLALTVQHWRHVIFADESRFMLFRTDGRVRVRRMRGEGLRDDCVQERVAGGGGSVHVWGAFHSGAKSQLVQLRGNVTGASYRDTLATNLVPWARQTFGNNFRFQDDNAPAHRARIVQNFMAQEAIQVLPQPACSPDTNPIEHLWDALGRAVSSRDPQPSTLAQLGQFLQEEWDNLGPRTLENLVESMPRRMAAIVKAKGGHTRY